MTLVEQLLRAAKEVVEAISFDENGALIGGKWMGDNGGLLSRETNIKADALRRAIAAVDSALTKPSECVDLSQREMQVARAVQEGKPNKVIAFELGISEMTVKLHLTKIMQKLGVTNRTQAAVRMQAALTEQEQT